jgi:hypothetical protein
VVLAVLALLSVLVVLFWEEISAAL